MNDFFEEFQNNTATEVSSENKTLGCTKYTKENGAEVAM